MYVRNENCWLLGFCDASKDAYATTVYLRSGNSGNITTHLLYSKTKIAPKKNSISSPRLELLAVLIDIRSMTFDAKEIKDREKYHMNTMHDSQTNKLFPVLVKNRIDEIRSEPNIHTREESVTDLKSRILWWKGLEWITSDADNWPTSNFPEVTKETLLRNINFSTRKTK